MSALERLTSVDVLRGFALLGILAMNIVGFAWPGPAYGDPLRGAGFAGSDRAVWFFNHLVFEAKMMTIFSMLFGAGLVLMNERAGSRGGSLRGVYYRRVLWLLVIGAIHAYLIWDGDILFIYAECGLLHLPVSQQDTQDADHSGRDADDADHPLVLGFGAAVKGMKAITARVDAQVKAGETPRKLDKRIRDIWTDKLQKEFKPDPAQKLVKLERGDGGLPGRLLRDCQVPRL